MNTLDTGITISHLTKRFGGSTAAVDDVSLSVPAGSDRSRNRPFESTVAV